MTPLLKIDTKVTTKKKITDAHLLLSNTGSISVNNSWDPALTLEFAAAKELTLNLNGNLSHTIKPGNSSPAIALGARISRDNENENNANDQLTIRTGKYRPTLSATNTNSRDGSTRATAISMGKVGTLELGLESDATFGASLNATATSTLASDIQKAILTTASGIAAQTILGNAKNYTGNITVKAQAKAGEANATGIEGQDAVRFDGEWAKGTKLQVTATAGSLTTVQSATATGITATHIQLNGPVATAITVSATSGNGKILTDGDSNPQAMATGMDGVAILKKFSGSLKVTASAAQAQGEAIATGMFARSFDDAISTLEMANATLNVTATGNKATATVFDNLQKANRLDISGTLGALSANAQSGTAQALAAGINHNDCALTVGTLKGAWTIKAGSKTASNALAAGIWAPSGSLALTQQLGNLTVTAEAAGDTIAAAYMVKDFASNATLQGAIKVSATSKQSFANAHGITATGSLKLSTLTGALTVNSQAAGDCLAFGLTGSTISAQAFTGAMTLSATGATVSARAINGDLTLQKLSGAINIKVKASTNGSGKALYADNAIQVNSLTGAVTVAVTATQKAEAIGIESDNLTGQISGAVKISATATEGKAWASALQINQEMTTSVLGALTVSATGGKGNVDGASADAYAVYGESDDAAQFSLTFANSLTVTATATQSLLVADHHATAAALLLKTTQSTINQPVQAELLSTSATRGKITATANTVARAYLAKIDNQSRNVKQAQLKAKLDGGNWNVSANGKTGAEAIGLASDTVAITAATDESAPLTDLTLTATTATGRASAYGVKAEAQIEYHSAIRNLNVSSTAKGTTEDDSAVAFGLVAANVIDGEGNLSASSAGILQAANLNGNFKINAKSVNGIARAVGLASAKELELNSVADNFKLAIKAESAKSEAHATGIENLTKVQNPLSGNWQIEAKGSTAASAKGFTATNFSGNLATSDAFQLSVKAAAGIAEAFGFKINGTSDSSCVIAGKQINISAISSSGGAAEAIGINVIRAQELNVDAESVAVTASGGEGSAAIGISSNGNIRITGVVAATVAKAGNAIGVQLKSGEFNVSIEGALYAGRNANAASVVAQLNKLLQNGGSAAGLLNSIQPPDSSTRYLAVQGSNGANNITIQVGAISVGDIDLGEGTDCITIDASSQIVGNISNTESIHFAITQDATKNPTILGRTDINFLSETQLSATVHPAQLGTYVLAKGVFSGDADALSITVNGVQLLTGETRQLDTGAWAKLAMVKSGKDSVLQLELLYDAEEVLRPPSGKDLSLPESAPAATGSMFGNTDAEFRLYGTGAFTPDWGAASELFGDSANDDPLKRGLLA